MRVVAGIVGINLHLGDCPTLCVAVMNVESSNPMRVVAGIVGINLQSGEVEGPSIRPLSHAFTFVSSSDVCNLRGELDCSLLIVGSNFLCSTRSSNPSDVSNMLLS